MMVNYYYGTTLGNFIVSHPNNPNPIKTWNPPKRQPIIEYPLKSEWEKIKPYARKRSFDEMHQLKQNGQLPMDLQYNIIRGFIHPSWSDYPDVEFALTSRGGIIMKFPHHGKYDKKEGEELRKEAYVLFKRFFGILNLFMTLEEPRLSEIFMIRQFNNITDLGVTGPPSIDWAIGHTWKDTNHFSEQANIVLLNPAIAATIAYQVVHHEMFQSIFDNFDFPITEPYDTLYNIISGAIKNWLTNNYIAAYSLGFTGIEVFIKHFEMKARKIREKNGENIDLSATPNLTKIKKHGLNQSGKHILTEQSAQILDKIYDLRGDVVHEGRRPTKMEASKLLHLLKWMILHKISDPNSLFRYRLIDFELNPTGDWVTTNSGNPRSKMNNDSSSPFYYWLNV